MKNIIQLLMSSLMLFLLISSVFVISFPPVYGAGGSSISNAVELETGKISETWTSGTEYYKVNVLAGQTISINVDLISGTDIDLYLYDPDSSDSEQVQLASSVNGEGIDEIITFTASKSGYYFIKLTGNQWSGLGTYDLNVFITDFDVIFSDWGTQTIPVEVTPGDLGNNLQIVLRNGGDFDINNLSVELMNRGDIWFDTGTHRSLLQASQFIQSVEHRQGIKIGCPEEVAYKIIEGLDYE